MELEQILGDFAAAMKAVDGTHPQATSWNGARTYQAGIGPFDEDTAVLMTLTEMQAHNSWYLAGGKRRYPMDRNVCDLALGELPEWAIEVKLARVGRDNGTYEDAAIKKVLSPYAADRSAVTDCIKLADSAFGGRLAVVIYGFEDPKRPLPWLIDAFEAVVAGHAQLGPRAEAPLLDLVHPVFTSGAVYGWEIFR